MKEVRRTDFRFGARKGAIIPSNSSRLRWCVLLNLTVLHQVHEVVRSIRKCNLNGRLVVLGRFGDLLVALVVVLNPAVCGLPFP